MLPFADITFQLVDLPALTAEHAPPWLVSAVRPADACLLVVDVTEPGCVDAVAEVHDVLAGRRITLTGAWSPGAADDDDDLFALRLPALLVATKADEVPNLDEELATFEELGGYGYPSLGVSAQTGDGLDRIGPFLFEGLGIVRVYTKLPGEPADRGRPFTLRRGQTLEDVAWMIHKELATGLRFARLWRGEGYEGRQIGKDHPLEDGDIVELHVT